MKELLNNKYFKYGSLLFILVFGLILIDRNNRRKQIYEILDVSFDLHDIEYGSKISAKDLVKTRIGELKIEDELDPYQIGDQILRYTVSKTEERYKQNVERTFEITVRVEDTNKPIIELEEENVSVYKNSDYDPKDNVSHVYDIVDGNIEDYEILTDLDLGKAGEYEVKVKATDKNGLSSEKTFTVNVRNRAVSGSEGYNIIYAYLTNTYGYNKAAACGILANMRYESNFNPDIGDYYYGLCQWGGNRQNNLFSYCSANGLDAASIEGQLAYLDHELSSSYSNVKNYLLNTENTSSGAWNAADYFCRNFEGAASSEGRGDLAASYFES